LVKYVLIFFISLQLKIFSQGYITYHNTANEAEYLFHTGQFISTEKTLLTLKDKYTELKPRELFYLGITYYYLQDTVNGFKNIELAAQDFLYDKEAMEYYLRPRRENLISDYAKKRLDSIGDKIEKKKDDIRNQSHLGDSVTYYIDLDQLNRADMSKFQRETDDQIQRRFLNFMKREGVPNPLLYGVVFSVIFLHVVNEDIYREYEVYLFDQVIKGNLCPREYAFLVDRKIYSDSNGRNTKYGAYSPKKNLLDANALKKDRESIGLSLYCPTCDCSSPNYKRKFGEK
jgi:hypothetical protein